MMVVDRFTNYAHFIPLTHPYSSKKVAEVFIAQIARLHGMPRTMVTDCDPIFEKSFWQEFVTLQGMRLKMSSVYHPLDWSLQQYLSCFASQQPRQWSWYLSWVEFWYNTTFHQATTMTPFQALYGRPPPSITNYLVGASTVGYIDKELLSRDKVLKKF